jgi:hypothetical protein
LYPDIPEATFYAPAFAEIFSARFRPFARRGWSLGIKLLYVLGLNANGSKGIVAKLQFNW